MTRIFVIIGGGGGDKVDVLKGFFFSSIVSLQSNFWRSFYEHQEEFCLFFLFFGEKEGGFY